MRSVKFAFSVIVLFAIGVGFGLGVFVGRETHGPPGIDSLISANRKPAVSGTRATAPASPETNVIQRESILEKQAVYRDVLQPLHSVEGRTIRAELLRLEDDLLSIRREDGEIFTLPLSRLKPENRSEVERFFASGRIAEEPIPAPQTTPAEPTRAFPVPEGSFEDNSDLMNTLSDLRDFYENLHNQTRGR